MNTRQAIQAQFGSEVVDVLDRFAEVYQQEAGDYDVHRTDRRELHKGQLLHLKAQLKELKGPIATQRIHVASLADRELLLSQIETFHDVDDKLEPAFSTDTSVILDSENSELFIFATEARAPAVIEALTGLFPGVRFVSNPETLDCSTITVIGNWPQGKSWLRMKYNPDEAFC